MERIIINFSAGILTSNLDSSRKYWFASFLNIQGTESLKFLLKG